MSFAKESAGRRGLTLVELLIVLLILAILTTVAVQATSGLADQARYETTQQNLQNIQDAIIGPVNQRAPDGSPLITGFVADMGRLPQPIDTISDPLRELWDPSVIPAAAAFSLQSVTLALSNPPNSTYNTTGTAAAISIQYPCGWRGPYVKPPMIQQIAGGSGQTLGQMQLLDGWGNPFDSLTQATTAPFTLTAATAGQPINVVRSRGADNLVDVPPLQLPTPSYTQDQYAPTQTYILNTSTTPNTISPPTPLTTFPSTGNVPVTVLGYNASNVNNNGQPTLGYPVTYVDASGISYDTVQVYLFLPGGTGGVLTAVASTTFTLSTTAPTPVSFTFTNVPIGPRAIQVFQYSSSSPTSNVGKRSPLANLMVPSGGVPTQTLILQ